MNLSDAKVMLCNCDGTMTLDGTKLAKACGAEGGCTIATSLCRTETGDLAAAMRDARDANRSLLIACTQETSVFDAIAEEIVNAELDLVLTKGKSVADAIADAERMGARRARR